MITSLPISAEASPDWNALDETLNAMEADALIDYEHDFNATDPENVDPEQVRERLRGVAATVRSAIEEGSRELDIIEVPGWVIFATGGASWGDAPTELFEHFQALSVSGLARAAGFHSGIRETT